MDPRGRAGPPRLRGAPGVRRQLRRMTVSKWGSRETTQSPLARIHSPVASLFWSRAEAPHPRTIPPEKDCRRRHPPRSVDHFFFFSFKNKLPERGLAGALLPDRIPGLCFAAGGMVLKPSPKKRAAGCVRDWQCSPSNKGRAKDGKMTLIP